MAVSSTAFAALAVNSKSDFENNAIKILVVEDDSIHCNWQITPLSLPTMLKTH
jgi:hypothetical protein